MELILNVEHYEYYDNADVKEIGMRLIIHDENELPIRKSGIHLSPGYSTYVEVKKTEVRLILTKYFLSV